MLSGQREYDYEVSRVAAVILLEATLIEKHKIKEIIYRETYKHIFVTNMQYFNFVVEHSCNPDEFDNNYTVEDHHQMYLEHGAENTDKEVLKLAAMYAFNKDIEIQLKELLRE